MALPSHPGKNVSTSIAGTDEPTRFDSQDSIAGDSHSECAGVATALNQPDENDEGYGDRVGFRFLALERRQVPESKAGMGFHTRERVRQKFFLPERGEPILCDGDGLSIHGRAPWVEKTAPPCGAVGNGPLAKASTT